MKTLDKPKHHLKHLFANKMLSSLGKKEVIILLVLLLAISSIGIVHYGLTDHRIQRSSSKSNTSQHSNQTTTLTPPVIISQPTPTASSSQPTTQTPVASSPNTTESIPSVQTTPPNVPFTYTSTVCLNIYQSSNSNQVYTDFVDGQASSLYNYEHTAIYGNYTYPYNAELDFQAALTTVNGDISSTNQGITNVWNQAFNTPNPSACAPFWPSFPKPPLVQVPICDATTPDELINCLNQVYPSLGVN